MKKLLFLVLLCMISLTSALAQSATQNPKSRKTAQTKTNVTQSRGEVYVGYSGTVAPTNSGGGFSTDRKLHNGIGGSATYNVSRYVGIKGDGSMAVRDVKETNSLTRRTTVANLLGGVQIKDAQSEAVVQPFAHALIGVAHYRQTFREINCSSLSNAGCGSLVRGWGLAGVIGGGFDLKLASRTGFRFVGDYNPMRIQKQTINNFRFGVGLVIK